MRRLQTWLAHPRAPSVAVALGLLLCTPSLVTGLAADDYFHALVLRDHHDLGPAIPTHALDMFSWADGDPGRARAMMEIGMTGWWTDPFMRMAYLRPLSVATHWLDFTLWPSTPWLMHLHSLAWLGLALVLLGWTYRRLMAPTLVPVAAALALLLYAVDDARGMTVGWIANRNALVALACAVPVLALHDRAVRTQHRPSLWLAPLLLVVALCAGEASLAIVGYLFGYAVCVDPGGARRGMLRLWPYALVVVGWAIAYRALGYGAQGSGLVIDPGSEPGRYLGAAVQRVPILLLAQLGFPPSDGWLLYPVFAAWLPLAMLALAVVTIAVLTFALAPVLRDEPQARMWALGMLLACLPVAAQFPHDRLLSFVGVGAAPMLAIFLTRFRERGEARSLRRRFLERPVATVLVGLHLVLAPLWLPFRTLAPADTTHMLASVDRAIGEAPGLREQTVVLVNPPAEYVGYLPSVRAASGRVRPRALRWLATGAAEVAVERVDARTLRVRPKRGFLWLATDRMQRARPFAVGDEVVLSDLHVTVTAVTSDARPAEILARFEAPLEDARYRFLAWDERGLHDFRPPAVGARVTLPPIDYPSLLPKYPGGGDRLPRGSS